jgi:hypothetical protein
LTSIGRVLAYDFAIVGDDKPVALIDRPELADVFAEPDPAKQLAMYAPGGRDRSPHLRDLSGTGGRRS